MLTPAASAAGSLSRIDAQARPGLPATCSSASRNRIGAHDHRVAVERDVSDRPGRPAHRRRARRQRPGRRAAPEAAAAAGEVVHRQHDRRCAREHQRDQGEVQAGEPECRQADEHADRARDPAGGEQEQRKRQRRRIGEPRADPAADREQRHLAERDHPDAAVEDAEAERCDRVDGNARRSGDPVGAGDVRDAPQGEREQADDDDGADDRPTLHARHRAHRRGTAAVCRRRRQAARPPPARS